MALAASSSSESLHVSQHSIILTNLVESAGMDGEGPEEGQGQNEIRLRHCLDPRTRRWARAEFFCSALDRPWLVNNGVQELCSHCNISPAQLSRLSRREWGCIRRALGRPRRLSLAFLRQVQSTTPPSCPAHTPPVSICSSAAAAS